MSYFRFLDPEDHPNYINARYSEDVQHYLLRQSTQDTGSTQPAYETSNGSDPRSTLVSHVSLLCGSLDSVPLTFRLFLVAFFPLNS